MAAGTEAFPYKYHCRLDKNQSQFKTAILKLHYSELFYKLKPELVVISVQKLKLPCKGPEQTQRRVR